jgi:hypothetical protein
MIILFCFGIVYSCEVRMVNIGVRGINSKVIAELIYIPRKVSVFIYLLLVGCSIRILVIKIFR